MTQKERVLEIKNKVENLIDEAIELLDSNYNMENIAYDNPAYQTMMDLISGLLSLNDLNENNLKNIEL